jgi:hypothetical protein
MTSQVNMQSPLSFWGSQLNPESLNQEAVPDKQNRSFASDVALADTMSLGEQFEMGSECLKGTWRMPKDLERAIFYLTRAAERDHYLAAYTLACLYLHGAELPQNLGIAREFAMKLKSHGPHKDTDQLLAAIDAKQNAPSPADEKPSSKATNNAALDKYPRTNSPSNSSSIWPPLAGFGGIVLLVVVAGAIDKNTPGGGRTFIGWVVGLGALGIFLNIVVGRTVKQTKENVTELIRNVALTFLGIFLLGGIGFCSSEFGSSQEKVRGEAIEQVRKP